MTVTSLAMNTNSSKKWALWFCTLSLFALPISSTGKSIFIALAMISILADSNYRHQAISLITQPWCYFALALLGWALLACFWSPAPLNQRLLILEKYSKLLYLPFLVIAFQDEKTKSYGLHAFLAATLLTSVLAIGKNIGLLKSLAIDPEHVFRNHIMTGFMVSFACYLALNFYFKSKQPYRLAYLFAAMLYTGHVLLVNGGRMGYLVYFLLMGLFVLQHFSLKMASITMLLLLTVFGLAYQLNSNLHQRVDLVATDLQRYHQDEKNTAIGFRLQFHQFALALFQEHPLFGNGTGSFSYRFAVENPVPGWGMGHKLLEPHSQYWLTAAEFGSIGVVLLLTFFASLFRAIWQNPANRFIGLGILIPFCLGNLTDSLLFYSGSGYFFLLFVAMGVAYKSYSSLSVTFTKTNSPTFKLGSNGK